MKYILVSLSIALGLASCSDKFIQHYDYMGDYKEDPYYAAIHDYTRSIYLDSTNYHYFYARGYVRASLDDFEGAIQDCVGVIKLYRLIFNKQGQLVKRTQLDHRIGGKSVALLSG